MAFEATWTDPTRSAATLNAICSALAAMPDETAAEIATRFLNSIAKAEGKAYWPTAWKALANGLKPEVVERLRVFAPVSEALESGNSSILATLPPEQRDFVEGILKRFDSVDRP